MIKNNNIERWQKKRARTRKKISGTQQRPRLTVYRSLKHVYAQIIDDNTGTTVAQASTLSEDLQSALKNAKSKKEICKLVGMAAAKKALEKNIKEVVFDRNGYMYHGRIKAIADGAREAGLKF